MNVVSKTEYPIRGDHAFVRVISVDADGQFECNLPAAVARIVNAPCVTGSTKAEVEGKFMEALRKWRESSTRESTVIRWKIDDFGTSLCASVFKETIATSGEEACDFEEIGSTIPEDLRRGAREIYGKPTVCRMEWTPEREAFFAKLGASMQVVAEALRALDDVEYAMECADRDAVDRAIGYLLLSLERPHPQANEMTVLGDREQAFANAYEVVRHNSVTDISKS